MFVIEMAY